MILSMSPCSRVSWPFAFNVLRMFFSDPPGKLLGFVLWPFSELTPDHVSPGAILLLSFSDHVVFKGKALGPG